MAKTGLQTCPSCSRLFLSLLHCLSLHVLIQTHSMLLETTPYIFSPKNFCPSWGDFPRDSTLSRTFLYGKPFGTWFCFLLWLFPSYVSVKKAAHFPWWIFMSKVERTCVKCNAVIFPRGYDNTSTEQMLCLCLARDQETSLSAISGATAQNEFVGDVSSVECMQGSREMCWLPGLRPQGSESLRANP